MEMDEHLYLSLSIPLPPPLKACQQKLLQTLLSLLLSFSLVPSPSLNLLQPFSVAILSSAIGLFRLYPDFFLLSIETFNFFQPVQHSLPYSAIMASYFECNCVNASLTKA